MTEIQDTVPHSIAVVRRLRDAINDHDLGALVDCFAPGFRSELPTFPDASFTSNENVRRNWDRIDVGSARHHRGDRALDG